MRIRKSLSSSESLAIRLVELTTLVMCPASREVTGLLRVFPRQPYRLFGSPNPLQCCLRPLLRSFGLRVPQPFAQLVHPLSSFSLLQRPLRMRPFTPHLSELRWLALGSSREVPLPSALSLGQSAIACFHTSASPFGLSQTLEGFILTEPHGLVSYRTHSWDSHSPGFSPHSDSARLIAFWYPLSVSASFRRTPPALPGLFIPSGSVPACGVLHPQPARDPLEFSTVSTVFLPPPCSCYL
jgi:hypothetical protein